MIKKTHTVGSEELVGSLFSNNEKAQIFFLHGGGGGKEGRQYIQQMLYDQGVSSFAFDFSGHGESTGLLKHSSLKKRTDEAYEMIKQHRYDGPITVCASSMGCHIAVKLLEVLPIGSLVLIAPAVYSKHAYRLRFDSGFTEEIRREKSYLENDTMQLFEGFEGSLRIVLGEEDTVIPSGVIGLLKDSTSHLKKRKIIALGGFPHKVHAWLSENKEKAVSIADEIVSVSTF